jgi:hypothetical protein
MNDDPLDRDPELGALLRDANASLEDGDKPDWDRLRRDTVARATPELVRLREVAAGSGTHGRRPARWWASRVGPVALAASLALLVVLQSTRQTETATGVQPALLSIDDIMDADISDDEFRAVLFGAADADALLLLAAADPDDD